MWLGDGGDGATGSLNAFNLPVGRVVVAAFERVDAIARARRAGGDSRTLGPVARGYGAGFAGRNGCETAPVGRQGVVELQIPLATAIGADSEPGEVAGYGPVLADVAQQIAQQRGDVRWRFSVTYKGELVYQGLTRARPQPPPDPAASPGSAPEPRPARPVGRVCAAPPAACHPWTRRPFRRITLPHTVPAARPTATSA